MKSVYITVSDALKLPSFQNAQVIAGSAGLDRKIKRISVVECPEFPVDYDIMGDTNQLFADGDFFVSSLFAIKDEPEQLLDTVKLYQQFHSSGLCIVLRYYPQVPQTVIDYANAVKYPLITLEKTTAYADVISDVMKAIFARQHNTTAVMLLDQILNNANNDEKTERLAYTLNSGFLRYMAAFYLDCDPETRSRYNVIVGSMNADRGVFAVNYHHAIIGFYSSDRPLRDDPKEALESRLVKLVNTYTTDYHLGISDVHDGVRHLRKAVQQATVACEASRIRNKTVEMYQRIGSYKVLFQVEDRETLRQFYEDTIAPLKMYDQEKKSELLHTMISYVENKGDIKKAAAELFQHENTIRYRLNRISQLWGMENNQLEFYEHISIARKVYEMLTPREIEREP